MTRWDLVYKWADPETRSIVDAVTSALENCDRKLTEALAASPAALDEMPPPVVSHEPVTHCPICGPPRAASPAALDPWHPDGDCLAPSACGVTGYYCSNFRVRLNPLAEAASPAALDAEALLRDLVAEVGREPIRDNRARKMGAWIRARNWIEAQDARLSPSEGQK